MSAFEKDAGVGSASKGSIIYNRDNNVSCMKVDDVVRRRAFVIFM